MSKGRGKCPKLAVFSGRQAKLNVIIFLVLQRGKPLTGYDLYLAIRSIKGYRHTKRQCIDRRVKALCQQGWLKKAGIRPAKAHFLSPLYKLSVRAQAALALSKKDLNQFLEKAPESNIQLFIDALSISL